MSIRIIAAYLLGMLFFLYAFMQRVAPSVMTSELMRDFAVGATSLGVLSSAYFYVYAALQLPIGLLTDRFGPRRLMSLAALCCAVASIGFAWSDSLLAATLFRACIGGAVAFAFVGTLTIIVTWFDSSRFGLLAGVLQSMGMLGALAGQAPLRWLIERVGWQQVFVQLAVVAAVLSVMLYLLVPQRPSATLRPKSPSLRQSIRQVVANPQSWFCALMGFGMAAPLLAFAGLWAIPWLAVTRGFNDTDAASVVAWFFIGWAIGAPVCGWLSDSFGRRKPVMLAGALLSLTGLLLLVYVDGWGDLSLSILFFLTGCGGSTMIILFGSVRELNAPLNNATAMGFANTFVVGSGAVMQLLLGWLLDTSSGSGQSGNIAAEYAAADYRVAFTALIATAVLAVLAASMIRETYCQQQG